MDIHKVVIPAAGLGTRFLPLTKVLFKELLPLVDEPMISYMVKEAIDSDINHITFVLSESKKEIMEYFKEQPKLVELLKERKQDKPLDILEKAEAKYKNISFSCAIQTQPKGDGDAILKAKQKIGKDGFGVMFADDVFDAKIPALEQLKKVFLTAEKPIIGLKKISKEKLSSYGVVKVEKIANRLYKIKELVEKPELGKEPSDLAICGRYILTPEIFGYLERAPINKKGETILADALRLMLEDGKAIYGYDIEGEWLECGKMDDWIRSNVRLCLNHPKYGAMLKEMIKREKLI